MKKLDVDDLLANPKNGTERVAVCYFLLMTCPDIEKHENKLLFYLWEMCRELDKIDESLWDESKELAKRISTQENVPFFADNLKWMDKQLSGVQAYAQTMEGVH